MVRKDEWDAAYEEMPFIGRRPSANTQAPVAAAWYERIGLLMPKRSDVWWELHAGGHREHIAGEVVAAIRDHALPALRERMT